MYMSPRGRALLAEWEGARNKVYRDSGGAPTIGVGHLLTLAERRTGKISIGGRLTDYASGLTDAQVSILLSQDLEWTEADIYSHVRPDLTQNQFDALVSFVFNIGGSFEDVDRGTPGEQPSQVLRALNAGQFSSVPDLMRAWVYDNHVKVDGLVNRREKEIALWLGQSIPDI